MTYNDLYKEIIALGFESEVDSEERALSAVNRALGTIFTERPLLKTISIFQRKYHPKVSINKIEHKSFDVDTVNYRGRCYSFTTSGRGSYRIKEADEEKTIDFSGENQEHRGFLHGEGSLEFFGDFSFVVNHLSVFDELFGDSLDDIPILGDYREYNIGDYADDFMSFALAPYDDNGKAIKNASICGRVLKIPNDYSGHLNLTYKRKAKRVSGTPDEEILFPDGCEHLVALLAASYIWLDDDSEKAEYYMSLYREGMSAVKYYNRMHIGDSYQSIDGWA